MTIENWSVFTQSIRKRVMAAMGLVVTVGIIGFFLPSYNGFCFSQRRFLSHEEYFRAAVEQIVGRGTEQLISSSPAGVEFRSVTVHPFGSVDDFLKKNPNCCSVVPHNTGDNGPYTSFVERLFGQAARVVSIAYLVNYVDAIRQPKTERKTEQFAVTNCGRAWNTRH